LRSASGHNWSTLPLQLAATTTVDVAECVLENRAPFVRDSAQLMIHWDMQDDEKIIACFPLRFFSSSVMPLSVAPTYLFECTVPLPLRLLTVRAYLLFAVNWLLYFEKIAFEPDPFLACVCRSMSLSVRTTRFRHPVDQQSNEDSNEIQVNRKEAFEVRSGAPDRLNMSLITQLPRLDTDRRAFRRSGDKPWRVAFLNESGIDAADQLANSSPKQPPTPSPKGRNDVRTNRDCIVPVVDQ
jgi:hypothetical protein